jgi:3-methylfumaryl-CoA hydratase
VRDRVLGEDLARWIGRSEVRADSIRASQLAAWNATLDRDEPLPREGDPVPPGFHWTLFAPAVPHSQLGADGHPRRGGFLPPVLLPRRMWAGSRIRFGEPLRVGDRVEQTSVVDRIEEKRGRAGALAFVTVRRTVIGPLGLAVEEQQDLVYREPEKAAAPDRPAVPAATSAWHRVVVPDDVLLFRFSALTFNGHRIHYDRRYATEEEGYPGLVVHGPLLATLLLDLLRRHLPASTPATFSFKALRPTFDVSPFALEGEAKGDRVRLWSTDNRGEVAVEAEALVR